MFYSELLDLESDDYPMDREYVASSAIFNFENFLPRQNKDGAEFTPEKREGTESDVESLLSTFRRLNINIDNSRVFNDKTEAEVKQELLNCKSFEKLKLKIII